MTESRWWWAAALVLLAGAAEVQAQAGGPEIVRTAYGVPHIYADDLRGAGYGLAWAQLEDYGARVVNGMVAARGQMGRIFGRDSLEGDFARRPIHTLAVERWLYLSPDTRAVYEGFAAAINDFLRAHPDRFAPGIEPDFQGADILAREMGAPALAAARRMVERQLRRASAPAAQPGSDLDRPDDGSNAWALAPSRTRSGRAILLRNPHLNWDAGYYEGHVVVPGVLDFYGDFRIGSAFAVIGGFNKDLGWATTNNNVDSDEVYSVEIAPGITDHILLDGERVALTAEPVTVEYRNGAGYSAETRVTWTSPLGPVVERAAGRAFILRAAGVGEHRGGEMFLRMMRAANLAEWKEALRMQARSSSNLTYADRDGNIFYVWNGTLPSLPHPPGGDSTAVAIRGTNEVWNRLVPFDSMPQVENPPGGYVHNENSSPHFTNLRAVLDPARLPPNVEAPSLSLRSQLGLQLIESSRRKPSLEDVVRLKHDYRMLLADRVKAELLAIVEGTFELAEAIRILEAWDNRAAPESRGAVLFEMWWRLYSAAVRQPFAVPWSIDQPTSSPRGLASGDEASKALFRAVDSVRTRFGSLDVPWGDVHRARLGDVDVPVGGCHGALGCFRVLWFEDQPDGKRAVQGGDGWVLAVEFGRTPRAFSVLAYGQSNDPASPHHADQLEMFARGEMKPVAFSKRDVDRAAIRRYRAGPTREP